MTPNEIMVIITENTSSTLTGAERIIFQLEYVQKHFPESLAQFTTYVREIVANTPPPENMSEINTNALTAVTYMQQNSTIEEKIRISYEGLCSFCSMENPSFRCSKCKIVCYCNAECQKKNWQQHKQICKK